MMQDLIHKRAGEFDRAVEHFQSELKTLRTGRASAQLVEHMLVDCYGTKTPLIQLAQITVPESRTITIQPYDQNILKDIEKAISSSNLGINPINDGTVVRLNIPPMTEDRRKELVKVVGQLAEKTRVVIRNLREEIWKEIQRQEKDGALSEDERIRAKADLQRMVDKYNEEVKTVAVGKEQEVMII